MTRRFGTLTQGGAALVRRILVLAATIVGPVVVGTLGGGALVTGPTVLSSIDGTCAGVTVVVDFTELGGNVDVGCAEGEQPTGRDALAAAGFTTTDSQPGFLCAINSLPDPCPETFQGSFWSYWHSSADGEWTSYQVGADSSHPAMGDIEGWRYNDGTTPPSIAPSDAASALPAPSPSATASDQDFTPEGNDVAAQRTNQDMVLLVATVGFLAVIAAVVLVFVVRRRRSTESSTEPEADDTGRRD